MKAEELAVIKERAEKYKMDMSATLSNEYRITKVDVPKLVAEVERLQAQEHFAEYAIRQNKALWEALSKACDSLGADTLDYYEEEGGV